MLNIIQGLIEVIEFLAQQKQAGQPQLFSITNHRQ
jgi:hypothetical protein